MIETLFYKNGETHLRVTCARCKNTQLFISGGRRIAKQVGWKFVRGDVYCGKECNDAAKKKEKEDAFARSLDYAIGVHENSTRAKGRQR